MNLTLAQQAQLRELKRHLLESQIVLRGLGDFAQFREEKEKNNLERIITALGLTIRLIEFKHFIDNDKVIAIIINVFSTIKYLVEFNEFHWNNLIFQRIPRMRDLIDPVREVQKTWNLFFESIEKDLERMERTSRRRFTFFKNKKLKGILPV